MNKLFISCALVLLAGTGFGQNILITDSSFSPGNPMDCDVYGNGGTVNFFDDGGSSGNYQDNFSDTLVVCPDLSTGTKVGVSFGINAGFSFNIDSTDSIYVWDGPNTSAPLLGIHNSATDPNGFNHQASFENNPLGCLTIAFVTDDSINGTGWAANLSCGTPPQPFNPHMHAYVNGNLSDSLTPSDTGMIRLCLGDSILYVGSGDFPYSLESTGAGYSQTDTSINYKWFFSNGTVEVGDSVWFHPPNHAGYVVTLQVTDNFPNTEQLISLVRVAPRMDFSTTRALNDSICVGEEVELIAGLTGNDTVGVSPTVAITEVGGSFAGLTYLPDGSGINYEAPITISGFGEGQQLTSGTDILRLAVTMEHSYLGDLEMMLSCPNGDSIVVFNSYTGQGIGPAFAGGFGGGGIFMGDADDGFNGNPGIGWTYSFSDTLADWGTLGTEFANGNTLPTTISSGLAMNPDSIYLPEETFDDLIGCPINGTWKLTVRDNLGIDDGYIFDWAIFFNPIINPNYQSYTSQVVDAKWYDGNDNFLGGAGDTTVFDAPDSSGFNYYTFKVHDDFGCESDTTIPVYVTPRPVPQFLDTGTCNDQFTTSVNGADSALWQVLYGQDTLVDFFPSNRHLPVIIASQATGAFDISVTSYINSCTFVDTVSLEFYPNVPLDLLHDTLGCFGDTFRIEPSFLDSNSHYSWSFNNDTSHAITVSESGTYYLTVTGCGTSEDSIHVAFYYPPHVSAEILSCDSSAVVELSHRNFNGQWMVLDSDMVHFTATQDTTHFYISTDERGFINVGFYDSLCASLDSVSVLFEHSPTVQVFDSLICQKDAPLVLTTQVYPYGSGTFLWTGGSNDSVFATSQAGIYEVTFTNDCGTAYDSVHVKFKTCDFFIPNVITPNSDGLNDVFRIVNMEYYNSIYMYIYDRWGQKVYEGFDEEARWDARKANGKTVPDGVYFYRIVIDGVELQGAFTVITD